MLTFPDGMRYIGKSNRLKVRLKEHQQGVRTGVKVKEWVQRYGWDRVGVKELATVSDNDLNGEERSYIRNEQTLWPNGLNMTLGGDGGAGWGIDLERDEKLREKWSSEVKPESIEKGKQRLQKLAQLPDLEFHAQMAALRRRAEKRKMPPDKLERLYPNTLTLAQIRALQGKTHSIPGPKKTGKLTEVEIKGKKKERKRKWDEEKRTSSKSRPSAACEGEGASKWRTPSDPIPSDPED